MSRFAAVRPERLGTWAAAVFLIGGAAACRRSADPPRPNSPEAASIESLRQRVASNPSDAQGALELGRALATTQPAESARYLRQSLALDPAGDAWRDLFDLYAERGYLDRQIELCEQRLKAVPDDIEAIVRLVPLLLSISDRAGAAQWLEKAARLAPDRPEVAESRANLEYASVRFAKAVEAYAPLVTGEKTSADQWNRYSELLRASGRYADAADAVRKAIAKEPGEGSHHRQLAHILATTEPKADFAAAEAAARKAADLGDKSLDSRYWLAVAIDGQNRLEDAVAAFEEIAREDVSYEQAAFKLGRLYVRSRKVEKGRQLLKLHDTMEANERELRLARRNLRLRPDQLANHYKMATLAMRADDLPVAIAVLRRARQRFPDNRALKDALVKALEAAGRKTEAAAVSGKSQTPPPSNPK